MIAVYFFASVLFVAFAEYSIHRWWQHKHSYDHYHRHHYMGHNHYRVIDLPPWISLLIASPILLPLFFLVPGASYCFAGIIVWHSVAWTMLHRAFHGVVVHTFTPKWPGYGYLYRHHMAHHDRPDRNYGTVFGPLVDIVFGTRRKP